jgi:hypothetical protein
VNLTLDQIRPAVENHTKPPRTPGAKLRDTQLKKPGACDSNRALELYRDAGDSENDTTSNA